MIRIAALSIALLYLTSSAIAQTAPPPSAGVAAPPAKSTASKSTAKPPAKPPKAKAATKQSGPAETGPCGIGVIPVIGDQFVMQKIGITVFGNERAEAPIDSWNLDELVVTRVRASASGVAVRRIPYSKGAFSDERTQPPGLLFLSAPTPLSDAVRRIAGSANCERYVMVTRLDTRYGGTNQTMGGIGIVTKNALMSATTLFALTYIRIFDGRDFTIIKQAKASTTPESPSLLSGPAEGTYRELDESAFPQSPSDVANNATLRDGIRALVTATLDKTLPTLLGR